MTENTINLFNQKTANLGTASRGIEKSYRTEKIWNVFDKYNTDSNKNELSKSEISAFSDAVRDAIVRNGAVYFAAVGGAGALLSKAIVSSEVVAYDDLGTEAIRKLEVVDFPAIVVIDKKNIILLLIMLPKV